MRNSILFGLACVIVLLAACSGEHKDVSIKGSFKNLQDGQFYVFSTDPSWSGFDTIKVADGSFHYKHSLEDTTILTIQYPNFMQMPVIAIPGKTITIKGNANNLLTTTISGSEENELLTEFRHSAIKKNDTEILQLAERFIRSNPQSFASQSVLQTYFLSVKNPNYKKIRELLSLMLKSAPKRFSLQLLQSRLRPLLQNQPGAKLPVFNAVTLKGEKVSNQSLKGQYALISFWSTWGVDFLRPIQREREILKPYLKKLKVVNISLDSDTLELMLQVKRDTIPGMQICDKQSWQSPLVRAFGVRKLPSNLLINPQGVIIKRDMDEAELVSELQKSLKPE